jgi:hypothetical protein
MKIQILMTSLLLWQVNICAIPSQVTQIKPVETVPQDVLEKIEQHVATCGWGTLYYDVVPMLIKKHNYKNILEVGVALGGHAEALLTNTEVEKYFGIDPYSAASDLDPKDAFIQTVGAYSRRSAQANCDYLYSWVKHYRLSKFNTRCCLIRATSSEAAKEFADGSLDCIFIDGDHSFKAVMQDLELWWSKLRPGGLMVGDDYWMPAVAKAVNQFFAARQRPVSLFISETGYKIWGAYKS